MAKLYALAMFGLLVSAPAFAQQPAPTNYGIGKVTPDTTGNSVSSEYYSQLVAAMTIPAFPAEKKPDIISAIFNALGGTPSDTRKINVTLRVKYGGVQLPDHSLVTYTIDRRTQTISAEVGATRDFPLHKLGVASPIEIEVIYKDVKQKEFDINAVATSVGGLVPGSTVVSAISAPFVEKIADATSAVLGTMTNENVNSAYRDVLSPYSNNNKSLSIELKTRAGNAFGTVTLTLRATPTALRAPIALASVKPEGLKWGALEDPSSLSFEIAGVKRAYISEIRAMDPYRELVRTRTETALGNFCSQARTFLSTNHGLTLMDRADLVFQALGEIDYRPNSDDNRWYQTCFNSAEAEMLKTSRGLSVVVSPGASNLSTQILYALGCWTMGSTGTKCSENAPNAGDILLANMADTVGFDADTSFIPPGEIGDRETFAKKTVVDLLKGRATSFKCFQAGGTLLLAGDRVFRLQGRMTNGKIVSIRVRGVSGEALDCMP